MNESKKKIALVLGNLPSVEEVDQFRLLAEAYEINVISSESICGYLTQNSYFQDLTCVALKDHDENPSFLPNLEKVLGGYEIVIVKERLGLYAYQTLKARWRFHFRLLVWVDNLVPFPANDVDQMRTIRSEVTTGADGFIVQSKAARAALELEGVKSSMIIDLVPWVETRIERTAASRAEARTTLGIAESDVMISYLGQLEWEEGISDLVYAAQLMIMREPSLKSKLRLIFCGVGSFAGNLRELFVNAGIDNCSVYFAPTRESIRAIQTATDAIYISPLASQDRLEGDPYRIVSAMTQGIPLIAGRTALSEEYCGKHRIDFCVSSPLSLAKAIQKMRSNPALLKDLVEKNLEEAKKRFSKEQALKSMLLITDRFSSISNSTEQNSLDHRLMEIEAKVRGKQYVEAVDSIEAVFKSEQLPIHHKANLYRLIGDCFAKLGDVDGAKDAYIQGAELDPYSPKIFIGLGTLGLMKNSNDIAVLHFQKAISLAPDDEMANLGLGLAFQGMNELREASRWIIKSLSINPENSAALFSLVRISHECDSYEEAEKALRRYLTINPNDYGFIYSLGGILFKLDKFSECLAFMKQILDADPKDKRAAALAKQANTEIEQLKSKMNSSNG